MSPVPPHSLPLARLGTEPTPNECVQGLPSAQLSAGRKYTAPEAICALHPVSLAAGVELDPLSSVAPLTPRHLLPSPLRAPPSGNCSNPPGATRTTSVQGLRPRLTLCFEGTKPEILCKFARLETWSLARKVLPQVQQHRTT